MRPFDVRIAADTLCTVASQHPRPDVRSQVSARKSQRIDSSNKESLFWENAL